MLVKFELEFEPKSVILFVNVQLTYWLHQAFLVAHGLNCMDEVCN